MEITAREKIMFKVMKAIYESNIPIDFKGSMVLKACLMQAGYTDAIRHTEDIDANWRFNAPPTAEQMVSALQEAVDTVDENLKVDMFRMYGEKRSAGFKIVDTSNNTLFSMDIDINRPSLPTTTYELKNVSFRGVSVAQILADKVSVVSSNKVFRRIKDVIDLYYLSHAFPFDGNEVKQNLESLNRELGSFDGFVCRKDELQHAYEKFRLGGDIYKQPFELLYNKVKNVYRKHNT
jgi:hypothetical protein